MTASRDTDGPVLLDGRAFAERRGPDQAARAARVRAVRGRAPGVHIVGFGVGGVMPTSIARKLRACEAAGVIPSADVLDASATTAGILAAMRRTPADADGLFLEFPFPNGVDEDAVVAALPVELDVDIMSAARTAAFFTGEGPPPVTVSAGLGLLDDGGVSISGLQGAVVAEPTPFARMFAEALSRRGADMRLVAPAAARAARDAGVVVVCAARPGLLRSEDLSPGAVVIDAGYFNPGGRGDVDTRGGIGHLGALAPVPGGIGPATITMLVERVIEFAEAR